MLVVFGLPVVVCSVAYVAAASGEMNSTALLRGLGFSIAGTIFLGLFLLVVLLVITHVDSPKLYPLSYLPPFHPWNTIPYEVGPYSSEVDEARLIMKRKIFVGTSADTLRRAEANCSRLLQGASEEANCLVQSCAAATSSPAVKRFLSDSEKKQLCSGASDREYLYILGHQKVWYGC